MLSLLQCHKDVWHLYLVSKLSINSQRLQCHLDNDLSLLTYLYSPIDFSRNCSWLSHQLQTDLILKDHKAFLFKNVRLLRDEPCLLISQCHLELDGVSIYVYQNFSLHHFFIFFFWITWNKYMLICEQDIQEKRIMNRCLESTYMSSKVRVTGRSMVDHPS